jgi:hypothetical protein
MRSKKKKKINKDIKALLDVANSNAKICVRIENTVFDVFASHRDENKNEAINTLYRHIREYAEKFDEIYSNYAKSISKNLFSVKIKNIPVKIVFNIGFIHVSSQKEPIKLIDIYVKKTHSVFCIKDIEKIISDSISKIILD